MAEIREVIARGFHEHLSRRDVMQYLDNEEDCDGLADAALAAIKQAGFVVRPAEPTGTMKRAGRYAISAEPDSPADSEEAAENCYRAMIEAAST